MSFMKILWIYIADSLVKTRIPFTKINFIKVSHSFKIEESLKSINLTVQFLQQTRYIFLKETIKF